MWLSCYDFCPDWLQHCTLHVLAVSTLSLSKWHVVSEYHWNVWRGLQLVSIVVLVHVQCAICISDKLQTAFLVLVHN